MVDIYAAPSRDVFAAATKSELLDADIATLERIEFDDGLTLILASEHAGRALALVKSTNDKTVSRNILLMLSRRMLTEANQIQEQINAKI